MFGQIEIELPLPAPMLGMDAWYASGVSLRKKNGLAPQWMCAMWHAGDAFRHSRHSSLQWTEYFNMNRLIINIVSLVG